MARFYCKEPELSEVVHRASFVTRRGMTDDATLLTFASGHEIMAEPGVRNLRVQVHALTKSKGGP
jgi:hypothetical protein